MDNKERREMVENFINYSNSGLIMGRLIIFVHSIGYGYLIWKLVEFNSSVNNQLIRDYVYEIIVFSLVLFLHLAYVNWSIKSTKKLQSVVAEFHNVITMK